MMLTTGHGCTIPRLRTCSVRVVAIEMNSIACIAFTRTGCELAIKLARDLAASSAFGPAAMSISVCGPSRIASDLDISAYESLSSWTQAHFQSDDALVFVGAAGIAVRAIAPHIRDKYTDPAVVSVDEFGRFAVPLLSGHVGGANELARAIAAATGGYAAISTATDVNGLFAVDEWAARHGLVVLERDIAKDIATTLLEGNPVGFHTDFELDWEVPRGVTRDACDIGFAVTTDETSDPFPRTLHLVARIVTVGVGCRRGTPSKALSQAVHEALARCHVSPSAVSALASIDLKSEEPAIHALADAENWDLKFYSAEELAAVPGEFEQSDFVEQTVGVGNVCERAACAEGGALIMGKQAGDGVTVALAVNERDLQASFEGGK